MKKGMILIAGTVLLLSSCGTYTGSGAYTGGSIGAILGSAIGGIAGGPRGSDIGTIVGMAGGAAVGAAVGASADQKAEEEVHDHYQQVQAQKAQQAANQRYEEGYQDGYQAAQRNSGFDANNGGDDRLYDFQGSDYTGSYSASQPTTVMPATSGVDNLATGFSYDPQIEIVNARFVDDNQDGVLSKNETGKIIFEVYNRSDRPVFDVQPTVVEATGNKNIYISPSIHVERIAPGKGIRYTAMVKAGSRLRDGSARFCLSVIQGTEKISKVTEFNIPVRK